MEKHKNCPNCGSALEFDPESGALSCSHCGDDSSAIVKDETVEISENDFFATLQNLEADSEIDEEVVTSCDNCGAEIVFEPNITSDLCPYCASPISASTHSIRMIRPAALLPFKITRENAASLYDKWLKSRWFMPSAVVKEARMMPLNGIYMPHWTYDSNTATSYSGSRGEYYYVTVSYTTTVNGKTVRRTRQERRTRWYSVSGFVNNRFDDVLVPASKSMPEDILRELEPWDLHSLVAYDADYIRGFREESYSKGLADGFKDAKEIMNSEIRETVKRDIGGDLQRIDSMNVSYNDISYKHILLPVWLGAFRYRNNSFLFSVNARTGEVQGKRPYSVVKITLFVLVLVAIVAFIVALIMR